MKKFAVILAGCGRKDGSEINEAITLLLSIEQHHCEYQCFAPNRPQTEVIDRTDGVINLCEIKFTKEPFTVNADDESNLETKIARLSEESRTDKAIHLVLISAKGLKKNEYSSIFQNIITLEDLFKA